MRNSVYDVFLSHAPQDTAEAAAVERILGDGGLSVFRMSSVSPGAAVFDVMRKEIAASRAVLALVTPASVGSLAVGLEVGIAMSWRKPIYLVTSGVATRALPPALARYRSIAVEALAEAIPSLKGEVPESDDHELELLRSLYLRFAVPTDRLLEDPDLLEQITTEYNRLADRVIIPETLMTMLLRLRKRGSLPRLGKASRAASLVS